MSLIYHHDHPKQLTKRELHPAFLRIRGCCVFLGECQPNGRDKASADESTTPASVTVVKRRVNYQRLICNHYSCLEFSVLIAWVKKALISGRETGVWEHLLSLSPSQFHWKLGERVSAVGYQYLLTSISRGFMEPQGLFGADLWWRRSGGNPIMERHPWKVSLHWCIPSIFHRH